MARGDCRRWNDLGHKWIGTRKFNGCAEGYHKTHCPHQVYDETKCCLCEVVLVEGTKGGLKTLVYLLYCKLLQDELGI